MKIKVSDKVKFLNDTGSGVVTRIMDQKTALVQIDGGFEVPSLINNLVVDSGSYDPNEEKEEVYASAPAPALFSEQIVSKEKQSAIEDEEVLLAFVPDDTSAVFDTYLINSSSFLFKYTIARQQEGEMVLFHESTLEEGIKINLGKYQPGNLNDEEIFRVQGLFYNEGFYRNIPPVNKLLRISAKEMYDASSRKNNDYFHEKAILYSIYDWRKPKEEPAMEIDPEELKKAMYTKGDIKPARKSPPETAIEEVDLHIQQLVDNYKSLDPGQILDIQLSRFRTSIESAIIHKKKKVVFIHGVGNGKLKHEIRRLIDTEYKSNASYQDASFREYGYGATMALIR